MRHLNYLNKDKLEAAFIRQVDFIQKKITQAEIKTYQASAPVARHSLKNSDLKVKKPRKKIKKRRTSVFEPPEMPETDSVALSEMNLTEKV